LQNFLFCLAFALREGGSRAADEYQDYFHLGGA
jgi:hypothetical protein